VKDRYLTRTALTVGYDGRRNVYTYDVDSELEVLPGEPFHFRYGYDFEHHTPLDPFQWQYLVVRRKGGEVVRRPVTPVDPGPMSDLETDGGLRVWYGRYNEKLFVAPAVEYQIADAGKRKLSTAVCAAFYDTGVSFEPETAPPGTKLRVRYRYTGWPTAEAEALFKTSKVYDTPTLDPQHHYIFADEWPRLTFSQFVPLSEAWIYGRTPFMTGHNQRPTYELARNTGVGSGFAIQCGPGAYGKAKMPTPAPLPPGRYVVTAQVESVNTHGPGGRIEVAAQDKDSKSLREETHHVGNGTFKWKRTGFVMEIPAGTAGLTIAFGNAGTGDALFAEVEFQRLEDGAPVPAGVLARANGVPPKTDPGPVGAIADYRMDEGKGFHVYDHARGMLGMLELANVDWVVDQGRPALRFADNETGRKAYPRLGSLDRNYLRHLGYQGRDTVPVAIAGTHGGSHELKAFTVAAWVKPGEKMPDGRGDIVGLGARRMILSLYGHQPPYTLGAALNVNDRFDSTAALEAGRWYHVAMTGEPTENRKWRLRLYLDGKEVHEGVSEKFEAPVGIPPSVILGAELFYLHSSYYRGLIGRTTVFDRVLSRPGIQALARSGLNL
jgi:concanavalin A-like lectin/glucanase superfamily protein